MLAFALRTQTHDSIWLLMDTHPGRLVEGYFSDLNVNEIQGRDVSVLWDAGAWFQRFGGEYIMGSGITAL